MAGRDSWVREARGKKGNGRVRGGGTEGTLCKEGRRMKNWGRTSKGGEGEKEELVR